MFKAGTIIYNYTELGPVLDILLKVFPKKPLWWKSFSRRGDSSTYSHIWIDPQDFPIQLCIDIPESFKTPDPIKDWYLYLQQNPLKRLVFKSPLSGNMYETPIYKDLKLRDFAQYDALTARGVLFTPEIL